MKKYIMFFFICIAMAINGGMEQKSNNRVTAPHPFKIRMVTGIIPIDNPKSTALLPVNPSIDPRVLGTNQQKLSAQQRPLPTKNPKVRL